MVFAQIWWTSPGFLVRFGYNLADFAQIGEDLVVSAKIRLFLLKSSEDSMFLTQIWQKNTDLQWEQLPPMSSLASTNQTVVQPRLIQLDQWVLMVNDKSFS